MNVKLVSYSQPNTQFDELADASVQDLIAFCARVSNPSNQFNKETSEKLLGYLSRYKHWSPFEMASACLEIETTRDIARQILRHRSFSFQEFSQRYANPDQEFDDMFERREARLQDFDNRQNSIVTEDIEIKREWDRIQARVEWMVEKQYRKAIKLGIAKEQARALLPEGLTKSRMYMNGTIRSWIHFIELRSANGTQKEHMLIARECACAIAQIFPGIASYVENS